MANSVRAFQIFDSDAARAQLDPRFEPLDNSASERPDWGVYWPMRSWFNANAMEESTLYGFFPPRFSGRTGLKANQVLDFAAQAGEADVVTFSPHPCQGASFYNVFEHAANFFPGFLDIATEFLGLVNPGFSLQGLVNDSRNTVYENCFVARPRFWREWLGLFQRVFELAETAGSPLHEGLNRAAGPAQMKIVLLECIPSLLLSSRAFATRNYPPFSLPLSEPFAGRLPELLTLDALKIAYADTGEPHFVQQYIAGRQQAFQLALQGRDS